MSIDIQKARKERVCRACGKHIRAGMYVAYAGIGTRKITICENCLASIYTIVSERNKKLAQDASPLQDSSDI